MEFGLNGGHIDRTVVRVEDHAMPFGHRFDAVLIGSDTSRGDAAVRAAGGRVAAILGWREDIRMAGRPLLLIEAEGTDEDTLAEALPAVAQFAAERRCRVVAAFDVDCLEVVAASLLGEVGVELLCEPDLPTRIAALLAAASAPEPEPVVREGGTGGGPSYVPELPASAPEDVRDLRRAIRSRRLRDEFFMPGLFADPAWDMLLDLYAAELEEQPVSVSSLCIAAAVAPTTALRWIARMQEDGLLERRPDESDRRRAFMALTEVARLGMRSYLLAVRRAGLAVA